MENKEKLERLKTKLEKDVPNLPLAKSEKDIVPAEGNPQAEVMFIGEAAGYNEYLQRRPFVGAAGKLLTQSLSEIGLDRAQVWISNVLKVRPPGNRDPLPEEIEAYRPYLDEEIQIIKPRVIVTLGRFSLSKFFANVYITKIHGQARWLEWNGRRLIVFPMYHPAAALRNRKVMEMYKTDFTMLRKVLNSLNNQSILENNVSQKETSKESETNQQLTFL